MAALFRYLPSAGIALPVGKREALRIGADENYALEPSKPFLVSAPDKATAAAIGDEYVARMRDEDADMGDLAIGQDYSLGDTARDTVCFVERLA